RRERASINPPFSPAAPPPITSTSWRSSNSSVSVLLVISMLVVSISVIWSTSTTTMRAGSSGVQTLLPIRQTEGMHDHTDQALDAVGPRLRALRQQRQTTLAELSAATGISVSTLSRLESGARRPTLELLLPMARVYGVTLDDLVGAPPTGDPRIHLQPVEANGM